MGHPTRGLDEPWPFEHRLGFFGQRTPFVTPAARVSGFFALFRWLYVPLGLLALIAVGVHSAADVLDDRLLLGVEALDAWLDGLLAQSPPLAPWVERIDAHERTVIARSLAVVWELGVDLFIAVPAFGYDEDGGARASMRVVLARLSQAPTPMRVLRPLITGVFVIGGAYAVSYLVESTLFVGLVGDVAPPRVASVLARVGSVVAIVTVLASHGWRAVLRALQHADEVCEAQPRGRRRWLAGTGGTLLALPLAVALVLQARALLSLVL